MQKRRVAIAAAAICLLLSGCSSLSLSSPDILSPPKAEGNQAEIQELIQNSSGSDYEMVYPESGEFKSSVVFRDLDNDNNEEAIAMYTCEEDTISVLLAQKQGDDFRRLDEFQINAPKIDRIEFADFGSGVEDILISYPGSAATLQSMILLSVGDEVTRNDMINTCSAHIVGDFNGDKTDDLLTLALADGANLPTAKLFVASKGSLAEQSSCEISSDTREYVGLSFGKICEEISGAVVDAKTTDGGFSTQLICYDYNERSIINPLYVGGGYNGTKRAAEVLSADIDRDNIIEIPLCEPMEYSQSEESSSVCDKIKWSNYDYTQLSLATKQSAILCDRLGFLLNLAPDKAQVVTARYTGENSMCVYLWEYKRNTPERTTKLLTVKRYNRENYDKNTVLEAVAAENNAYVYTYIIENEDEYYCFSDDDVRNNIVLFENHIDPDSLK